MRVMVSSSAGFGNEFGNEEFVPILLGTGVNAYNIARCLHEVHGIRSLALGRAALHETAGSRIIGVRAFREFNEPDAIVRILNEVAAEFPGQKAAAARDHRVLHQRGDRSPRGARLALHRAPR